MKPISITITEGDRRAAKDFNNIGHCLLATTLRRRGYEKATVGTHTAYISTQRFEVEPAFYGEVVDRVIPNKRHKYYYTRAVVGRQFTFYPI